MKVENKDVDTYLFDLLIHLQSGAIEGSGDGDSDDCACHKDSSHGRW